MKETSSILVTIKFSFGGPVSHEELQKAIGRALNTRQFRLVGQYTILDTYDEIMTEVPASSSIDAPRTGSPTGMLGPSSTKIELVGPVAPIFQMGPKR